MKNKNRLNRIRKALLKDKNKLITIIFVDDSELKVTGSMINDSFGNYEEETEFIKAIKGKEIVSCSSYGKLVHIIQQLSEGR